MERVVRSQTARLLVYTGLKGGPELRSPYSGPLRVGRSWDRMMEGARF